MTSLMHGTVRDMRSEEECRPTMSFEQHALTDESETLCALKPPRADTLGRDGWVCRLVRQICLE